MHFGAGWSINKYFVICFISSSIYKSKQITRYSKTSAAFTQLSRGHWHNLVAFVMEIKLIAGRGVDA